MSKVIKTMDGNTAAAHVAYAFTEVSAIYPITPSSGMAEYTDEWSASGKKNAFGTKVNVVEMQSEAGAAGAMHGSLQAGALTTTYTASQGLLLMIPNIYKMVGELLPGVFHVAARAVAGHALSIFGDHSDVMAVRQTGAPMLSSADVQEVCDLGAVAHLSAIKAGLPFVHFFDGFRTSHEIQKVECLDYAELEKLIDKDALEAFRNKALNPEHPVMRGSAQNGDVFFQGKEASNKIYERVPEIVQGYMDEINKLTGRNYKLFNYYGAEDAENIIIAMGSSCDALEETVDYLNSNGEKVGFIKIHLYRPFSIEHFLSAVPKTVKRIAVLDRTKEPGAVGEPLFEDVCSAFYGKENAPLIIGGRYGLASKDFTPSQIVAVYNNLKQETPKKGFTVGINDDVTNLSLNVEKEIDVSDKETISCKFWGLGSDGTVGANKNSIKIIGDHTDMYVQAYFDYDSKKSGGITQSHLRFGKKPIRSTYLVRNANFVACHNESYIFKYEMLEDLKDGGKFLLNCEWSEEELEEKLPASVKRILANKNIEFYTINGTEIAKEIGLGRRINTVLQAAFFKIANIIPAEDAKQYMKDAIKKTYFKKGEEVLNMNYAAVDKGFEGAKKINVNPDWANAKDTQSEEKPAPDFIKNILEPINNRKGDLIPVSAFNDYMDGTMPSGATQFEKRGIAIDVPKWIPENCIQCNQCAYVCPHATIRPFLATDEELENAPEGFVTKKAIGKGFEGLNFRVQVDTLDCVGCSSCAQVCPAKNKALVMEPLETQMDEMENWYYALDLSPKENPMGSDSVKGSQFEQPLLEFSGACAGCGETPYAKLVTQLFGDRMYIANATGCSSIWGGSFPASAYTTNHEGHGPAWANSLFEDNAEFGLGMYLGVEKLREIIKENAQKLIELSNDEGLNNALKNWIDTMMDGNASKSASQSLISALEDYKPSANSEEEKIKNSILNRKDQLVKKSQWIFGGDGWAYDIGYGGLDHVLASGKDINVLVFDTEVYSNTGGQSSKSTPLGAIAKFAASGKKVNKKDLGAMAMSYGNVYVAQVGMGANQAQLIKALIEAENYPGPSIVIAYAPCISHGIKKGMGSSQEQIKSAVDCGYWHLYRYNPLLKEQGKNPFILDSKEPKGDIRAFLDTEVRYAALKLSNPEQSKVFYEETEKHAKERYLKLKKLAEQ